MTMLNKSENFPPNFETLLHLRDTHRFWDNGLLKACQSNVLTKEDFKYIFGQYRLYSKFFTRFITAVMTNSENDLHRAILSENLWEEGGKQNPENRHSEIFNRFLRDVLGVSENTVFKPYTVQFCEEYLKACKENDDLYGAAFLSLGTEGIVSRLYKIFVQAFLKLGIPDQDLHFFHLHIECDDDHALSLENIVNSFKDRPDWFDTSLKALHHALSLRDQFFTALLEDTLLQRVSIVYDSIKTPLSLFKPTDSLLAKSDDLKALYSNEDTSENIAFSVSRFPFHAQVLDPRLIEIPAGKCNEKHRHAHETFFYILSGQGEVLVEEKVIKVSAGEGVFVPRWADHQTKNTGPSPLVFLGVTDFNLTKKFPGNTEHSARKKKSIQLS